MLSMRGQSEAEQVGATKTLLSDKVFAMLFLIDLTSRVFLFSNVYYIPYMYTLSMT